MSSCSFLQRILKFHPNCVLRALFGCYMAGATWNCCRLGAFCAHHTTMSHHFMQNHICRVHACLAVTCHLHFQQNDQDPLLAPVVTQGWNGYWNKSQHRRLTPEKKILPPLQLGLKPTTFWSQVQCSETHTELSQPAMQQGTNPEVVTISREVHLDDKAGDAFAVAGAGQWGAVTQVVQIHAAVFGPHR